MDERMPTPPEGFAACRTWHRSDGSQMTHLVICRPDGGTPGPTICGLTRFPKLGRHGEHLEEPNLPSWSIGGGVSGPAIRQDRCSDCWAEALRLEEHADA